MFITHKFYAYFQKPTEIMTLSHNFQVSNCEKQFVYSKYNPWGIWWCYEYWCAWYLVLQSKYFMIMILAMVTQVRISDKNINGGVGWR